MTDKECLEKMILVWSWIAVTIENDGTAPRYDEQGDLVPVDVVTLKEGAYFEMGLDPDLFNCPCCTHAYEECRKCLLIDLWDKDGRARGCPPPCAWYDSPYRKFILTLDPRYAWAIVEESNRLLEELGE